jgi:hypothetical protein
VAILGPVQTVIPQGDNILIRFDIAAFTVDFTDIDMLGFFIENISHPNQTDYWIAGADLIFVPDTLLIQPGVVAQHAQNPYPPHT